MPLIGAKGAQSSQGFGQFALSTAATYIEDVFSTYLYTGNSSTQTITNGIDLSGKGGLVWIKTRTDISPNTSDHHLIDTVRGNAEVLTSNQTYASATYATPSLTGFNNNGFGVTSLGSGGQPSWNWSSTNYASWTFRKQTKFFDIVTYTGDGSSALNISHNLGAVPGCIIVKHTNAADSWAVYHRSVGNTGALLLNSTATTDTSSTYWNNTTPTSTQFTVGSSGRVNDLGGTYVAYLFAHDAGGFGLTGTDNVISCGSFTTDNTGNWKDVNLGYEPQWILLKNIGPNTGSPQWWIYDSMRGWANGGQSEYLYANTADAASLISDYFHPTATGFSMINNAYSNNSTFIYVAIRRGPMKVPTTGTSVFNPLATRAGTGAAATITTTNTPDLYLSKATTGLNWGWFDRLRGIYRFLSSNTVTDETNATTTLTAFRNSTVTVGADATYGVINMSGGPNYAGWSLNRAPNFFDTVCYTGNTTAGRTVSHNLGVVPQLMIIKARNSASFDWYVYTATTGNNSEMYLNLNNSASGASSSWNLTTPTASVFTLGSGNGVNGSSYNYVAYLFATCAGVSKVGSYVGNGTTQTVDCGFTGGARFLLVKNASGNAGWFVFDTVRGMVSGNDPYFQMNSTSYNTSFDSVDTTSVGFTVKETNTALNTNNNTYIFLAIA